MVNKVENTKEKCKQTLLKNINLERNNLCLKNKCDDFNRLLNLIANNNVPRLNQIIQTCIKQEMGINSIIEKISGAIKKIYNCKSYSKLEVDIGCIVSLIGGFRLVYALNQLGFIPSKSVIARALKLMDFRLVFSYKIELANMIKENLCQILNEQITFYSVKMDETKIVDRYRFCSKTNEIQGICYVYEILS
jgi:hypothetical protein